MSDALTRPQAIAYVALSHNAQAAATTEVISRELRAKHGYEVIGHADSPRIPLHGPALSEFAAADLVVADLTELDAYGSITLGAALASVAMIREQQGQPPQQLVVLADQATSVPAAVSAMPVDQYDRRQPGSLSAALDRALARNTPAHTVRQFIDGDAPACPPPDTSLVSDVLSLVPAEVTDEIAEPISAVLVTLYIQYIGSIVGEELAATAGLPPFPPGRAQRRDLLRDLTSGRRALDIDGVLDLLDRATRGDQAGVSSAGPTVHSAAAAGSVLSALLADPRTDADVNDLAGALSRVAARTGVPRTDIRFWPAGIKAVSRMTRLIVSATSPAKLGTMDRLVRRDSGLRAIATLGGAHFLGGSIGLLAAADSNLAPTYGAAGLEIAELTRSTEGQQVKPLEGRALQNYAAGLQALAARDDTVFSVEHPFHFRVLLEVLSDENRRYPAESVLTHEALRQLWTPAMVWEHFTWYRDQLPVVANFIDDEATPRDLAFIQHYISFGRTPHTSSFVRLDYDPVTYLTADTDEADAERASWWPEPLARLSREPMRNLPSSVCVAMDLLDRQRRLGRIWQGAPDESDLLWLAGDLVRWDGRPVTDGALARVVWDSTRWTSPSFPRMALAEIRTAIWTIEMLRRRLASLLPMPGAEVAPQLAALPLQDRRVAGELHAVLTIMYYFVEEYLSAASDGLGGLRASLDQLRSAHQLLPGIGSLLDARIQLLHALVDGEGAQLAAENARAAQLLHLPA